MSDAREIAEGLSEAQRQDLLAGNCGYGGQCYCASPHLDDFRRLGLAMKANKNGDARPTDLALAVCKILEVSPHAS